MWLLFEPADSCSAAFALQTCSPAGDSGGRGPCWPPGSATGPCWPRLAPTGYLSGRQYKWGAFVVVSGYVARQNKCISVVSP